MPARATRASHRDGTLECNTKAPRRAGAGGSAERYEGTGGRRAGFARRGYGARSLVRSCGCDAPASSRWAELAGACAEKAAPGQLHRHTEIEDRSALDELCRRDMAALRVSDGARALTDVVAGERPLVLERQDAMCCDARSASGMCRFSRRVRANRALAKRERSRIRTRSHCFCALASRFVSCWSVARVVRRLTIATHCAAWP